MTGVSAAWQKPENQLRVVLAVVLLGLLFVIPGVAKHFGDESFYTDAAVEMVRSGDYWTPRYPDGRLRFFKPILTYWTIAASYRVLGVSFFSSRLLFVLAGCLTIVLTYRLAMLLVEDRRKAVLAALMVASNVQMLTVSVRCTPDVLLTLFTLLSFTGFARILVRRDGSFAAHLLAFGGAGLAVQTKGILGCFPIVFAVLFCLFEPGGDRRWRSLWNGKAAAIGAAVALFWYVRMLALHGETVLTEFFADQVGRKVSLSPFGAAANLAVYFAATLRLCLPWTLLLAVGFALDPRATSECWRRHARLALLLGGWFLFVALIFSSGNMYRSRYVVISYPMLSILFAVLLSDLLERESFVRLLARVFAGIAGVALALGAVLTLGGAWIGWQIVGAGVLITIFSAFLLLVMHRRIVGAYPIALAGVPLAGVFAAELFLRPFFTASPAEALAGRLLRASATPARVIAWNMSDSLQSQVRVFTAGRIAVDGIREARQIPASGETPILLSEAEKKDWPATGYVLEQVGFSSGRSSSRDIRALLAHPGRAADSRNRIPYYIAWPAGRMPPP